MASDFHTHICHPGKRELLDSGRGEAPLWSLSFHPWYTKENPVISLEDMEQCAALGEIGFDKFHCEVSHEVQLEICSFLLQKAADHRKSVVLHWVGAYDKLFQMTAPFKGLPLLFHGYAKSSPGLLEELLKHGFFVSLSPKVISAPAVREVIRNNPGCRVGLESDDSGADIETLYDTIGDPDFEKAADEHFRSFLQL